MLCKLLENLKETGIKLKGMKDHIQPVQKPKTYKKRWRIKRSRQRSQTRIQSVYLDLFIKTK